MVNERRRELPVEIATYISLNRGRREDDTKVPKLTTQAVFRRFLRAVQAVRTIDQELPPQTLAALLVVSIEEGLTVTTISQKADIGASSTTRCLQALSEKHWKGKVGYQLIETRENPLNASSKLIYLSKKGRQFIDHLAFILKS